MLINEIVNLNNLDVIKGNFDLSQLGSRINSGQFADVYKSKKGNSVVKVASIRNFDNSYLNFIQIVNKNQHNPFFPKILDVKIYEREGKKFYPYLLVVEMEKLTPLTQNNLSRLYKQIGLAKDSEDAFVEFKTKSGREAIVARSNNPRFKEAMKVLEPLFRTHNPDFKMDNIMRRTSGGEPQLVITDPVH